MQPIRFRHSICAGDFIKLRYQNHSCFVLAGRHNARINAAARNEPSIQVMRIKSMLFPLALNELLGGVIDAISKSTPPQAVEL
jgi:hypothetical protein